MAGPVATLLGEYAVVRPIARGGMGAVFEVEHRTTRARYAAKTVLQAADARARERFRREAELLARCDAHPGIVRIHAFGDAPDGSPCMILDLVAGEGLDRVLEREGRLEPRRAASLVLAVATALAFVHERGIVHRDVKPSNVLLDESGVPRLTDFGLATARDVERLTRTGQFLGTFAYSPPEQTEDRRGAVGPWSDVFSAGAVLFHLLAGEPPVRGSTPLEVLGELHTDRPLRDVRSLAPGVPAPLAGIVARALEKDPLLRYRSAGELARDLALFLEGQPIPRARAGRSWRRALVLAVALAVAAGGGSLAFALARRARADAALAGADAAIDRARRALARGPRATTTALASEARAALEAGRASLRDVGDDRAADASPRTAALDALAVDLATGDAQRALAEGCGAQALALLEAAPVPADARGPDARLAHAAALVAVGRAAEALREVEAVAFRLEGAARGEAAEVEGDALLATGKPAEAALVFGRALDAGTSRVVEVRAKRAGAAALAGNDALADAESAALVSDGEAAKLALDPRPPLRLVPLAPALYGRAVRASDLARKGTLLEAAARLDPAPVLLRGEIARAWDAVAASEWDAAISPLWAGAGRPLDASLARRAERHFARVRMLDEGLWRESLIRKGTGLGTFVSAASDRGRVTRFLAEPLAEDPEDVVLAEIVSRLESLEGPLRAASFAHAALGLSHLPRPVEQEPREFSVLVLSLLQTLDRLAVERSRDELLWALPFVEAAARRLDTAEAWFALATFARLVGDRALLESAVERGLARPALVAGQGAQQRAAVEEIGIWLCRGQKDRALEVARRIHAEHPEDAYTTVELIDLMNGAGESEAVARLYPDVAGLSNVRVLHAVGIAALLARQDARVDAAVARLGALGHVEQAEDLRAERRRLGRER